MSKSAGGDQGWALTTAFRFPTQTIPSAHEDSTFPDPERAALVPAGGLTAPGVSTEREALRLVRAAHRLASRMQAEGIFKAVGKVGFGGAAQSAATAWLILPVPGEPNTSTGLEITPEAGALFPVSVGRDCEPLWVGLCRYPPRATLAGRSLATRLGKGWHLSGFSKTQFASLHGWEHFRRCHVGIVSLLAGLRPLGFRVRISDEGDYWPRLSERALRENLDDLNRLLAAAAGAMKDASGGQVESPIFGHREFERLEAEGAARIPPGFSEWLQKEAE
jgi:hypothetical protein